MTAPPRHKMSTFLSTLSLRRATGRLVYQLFAIGISIHALLAESDIYNLVAGSKAKSISIHALLAESDAVVQTPH